MTEFSISHHREAKRNKTKPGMEMYTYNASTREAEALISNSRPVWAWAT
jgi:hypothetical protein